MSDDHGSLLNRIDLRQLRYFVAVSESGSISAAAQRLHLSQPPLSVQIKDLETTLGVQLLVRHSSGITLTEAGLAMLDEARSVLARASRAVQRVRQIGRGEMGEVRVGMVSSIMWSKFPKLLSEFNRHYPQVKWSLLELTPLDQVGALHDHRIDVGIWRGDGRAVEGLNHQLLVRDKVMAVLPATHALAKRRKISLADLCRLPYFSMDTRLSQDATSMVDAMREHGFPAQVAHVAREPQTLLALAANHEGFSLLPDSLNSIAWPGIAFRPVIEALPAVDLYLHVRDQEPSPAVARFVEVMQSGIA